jgi:hypothetical protein
MQLIAKFLVGAVHPMLVPVLAATIILLLPAKIIFFHQITHVLQLVQIATMQIVFINVLLVALIALLVLETHPIAQVATQPHPFQL